MGFVVFYEFGFSCFFFSSVLSLLMIQNARKEIKNMIIFRYFIILLKNQGLIGCLDVDVDINQFWYDDLYLQF